jgi:hypothetical protein
MLLPRSLVTAVALASGTAAVGDVVDLGYAKYAGETLQNGISQWLGIRFAAAPLGELRFMPPQDPPTVDEVQPATEVRLSLWYRHVSSSIC